MERTDSGGAIFEPGESGAMQFHCTSDGNGNPIDFQLWVRPEKRKNVEAGKGNCEREGHPIYVPIGPLCPDRFQRLLELRLRQLPNAAEVYICACNGHIVE